RSTSLREISSCHASRPAIATTLCPASVKFGLCERSPPPRPTIPTLAISIPDSWQRVCGKKSYETSPGSHRSDPRPPSAEAVSHLEELTLVRARRGPDFRRPDSPFRDWAQAHGRLRP